MIILILLNSFFIGFIIYVMIKHDKRLGINIREAKPLEPRDFLIFKADYKNLKHPKDE